ncbi:hypothetical protein [Mesorhizobium sp. ANAO-SY3R2]|uniref:hypothetical protein n=1 Tax=Mesorhizobium sp. ANAO-SY3R2 TaxID=3166644 RepID=UPI0036714EB9
MRLTAVLLAAGIATSGSAHASSFVFLDSDATSPSSIFVGLNEPVATSFIALGTLPLDTNNVAAVDPQPKSHRMGPDLMVIRGGEIGSASPEPSLVAPSAVAVAPTQQAGNEAPMPATEPEEALPELR